MIKDNTWPCCEVLMSSNILQTVIPNTASICRPLPGLSLVILSQTYRGMALTGFYHGRSMVAEGDTSRPIRRLPDGNDL